MIILVLDFMVECCIWCIVKLVIHTTSFLADCKRALCGQLEHFEVFKFDHRLTLDMHSIDGVYGW